MTSKRLSQAQKDAKLDLRKWESSLAFVRAYNEWQIAQKKYGPYSTESRDTYKIALKMMQSFNRIRLK